jgi:hypothetical protein
MRNKYHNKFTTCYSGHVHDSKLEAGYCEHLRSLVARGVIASYAVQVRFPLVVNGKKICDHIVDFLVVRDKDNSVSEAHEAKGVETAVWKIKKKLFEVLYPGIKYIVIKKQGGMDLCQKILITACRRRTGKKKMSKSLAKVYR